MHIDERQDVSRSLREYYNESPEYLDHLKSRSSVNLLPYITEVLLHLPSGAKYMDFGCGTGISTALLVNGGLNVIGVDLSETFLAEARKNVDAEFFQIDGTHLTKFADESFDGLGMNAVIEHVPDVELLLGEIHRVLKPGGHLVIFTPNLLSPFTAAKHLLQRIFKGRRPHTPFYNTGVGALLYMFKGFAKIRRKRLLGKPSLEFRQPSFDETADDFDSVFLSNQVDLEYLLLEMNFKILKLSQGRGRIGKMLSRLFPYYAGGVGIVARKNSHEF